MQVINNVSGAPAPVGAYSPAVKANGFVFCAGQIAIDPQTGQLISGGVREQAERVLDNLSAVLEASGSSFRKVVMTTIFLSDIADAKTVNEIYSSYVDSAAAPARQTLAVKGLPLNALVEISVIAVA